MACSSICCECGRPTIQPDIIKPDENGSTRYGLMCVNCRTEYFNNKKIVSARISGCSYIEISDNPKERKRQYEEFNVIEERNKREALQEYHSTVKKINKEIAKNNGEIEKCRDLINKKKRGKEKNQ